MIVTSGKVVIKKDQTNLIGISIGGGAPFCPCLYIVQVNNFQLKCSSPSTLVIDLGLGPFRRASVCMQQCKKIFV